MVRVSWETDTRKVVDVQPGDGPGQYSADVDPSRVRDELHTVGQVSEVTIAASVATAYEGPFSPENTLITTETYSKPGSKGVATTLAFVEIADLVEKLETIDCQNCSYTPSSSTDWETEEREGPQLQYTDWICPKCDSIIHTEAYGSY